MQFLKTFWNQIFLIVIIFVKINADVLESTKCIDPSSFDFTQCKLPPLVVEKHFKSSDMSKKIVYCNSTSEFLNCMNEKISTLCNNAKNIKSKQFFEKINNAIRKYNFMYQKNCYEQKYGPFLQQKSLFKTSTSLIAIDQKEPTKIIIITNSKEKSELNHQKYMTTSHLENKVNQAPKIRQLSIPNFTIKSNSSEMKEKIYKINQVKNTHLNFYSDSDSYEDDECDPQAKCDSRSLHITCGYPAANPKSNLNAFCNELKHYIHCAKCKTINCKIEGSIVSIKKHLINQEASFYDKCTLLPLATTTTATTKLIPKSSSQIQFFNYYNEKTLKTKTTILPTTISTTVVSTTAIPITITSTITTPLSIITSTSTTISTSTTTSTSTMTSTSTLTSTSSPTSTADIQTTSTTIASSMRMTNLTLPLESSTQVTYSYSTTNLETTEDTSTANLASSKMFDESTQFQEKTAEENLKELATILLNLNSQKTSKNAEKFETNIFSHVTPLSKPADFLNNQPKENINYFPVVLNETIYSPTIQTLSKPLFDNIPKQNSFQPDKFQFNEPINEVDQLPIKSRNNPKNKSLSNNQFSYSFLKQIHDNVKNNSLKKIDHILISFDYIDLKTNTIEVSTSNKDTNFEMKVINRTDIFKGVKNGAVYLHSKTSFTLNLNDYASDFCLTSSFNNPNTFRPKNKKIKIPTIQQVHDYTCERGWTISLWIKVTNLNLFDKTILKVDNLINNQIADFSKFFVLKLSNFDIKVQFLYKKKLWTVSQNIIWKSEWTMVTLTWSEFEGITVYLNDKKLLCQQIYEYYSPRDENENMNNGNKNENLFLGGKAYNFESKIEKEAAFEKLRKRSRDSAALAGLIYIGLNNNINRFGRKFFWSYRDESSNTQQNVLLASTFSEAILLDELAIINYRINSKDIMEIYLKDYSIKNEYDSVEELMLLTSTDNKQAEIIPLQGANIKSYKDNSYLSLSGDKQFVIVPNLFDSCIADAENLCSFGFTATVWLKFTYNFVQFPIQKNFEQILFFFGSQDFSTGLEAILYVHSSNDYTTNELVYSYMVKVNFKSKKYILSKSFKVNIKEITELNNLNCLTVKFGELNNIASNLKLNWLNYQIEETESVLTPSVNENNLLSRSFSSYSIASLGDFGLKVSVLTNSNSIGIFGDISKQSFFNIKYFELKNYEIPIENIEYDFYSANPIVYQFNSLEKLFKMPHVTIVGSPQIVDTRYGRSLLFSKSDQKVVLNNVTNSCFGDLNLCKNGYTLKFWVCFTNYNNIIKSGNTNSNNNKLNTNDDENLSQNVSKRIYLISNGGEKSSQKGMAVIYDLENNQLLVYAKTIDKWYRAEVYFRLKLYVWYIMTITWDQMDGLRLYINNRLLDHTMGVNYTENMLWEKNENVQSKFTLGKGDYSYEELFEAPSETANREKNIGNLNFLDSLTENQTEDSTKFRNNLNKNRNYQINSLVNNYYEFIIHKLVQFDIKKYPDEIISKNVIVQEKKTSKVEPSMNWLWYTISGSFLSLGIISLLILIVIVKKRASNGFWSREHDLENIRRNNKNKPSKFCCSTNSNDEDSIEVTKNNFNLELKQCNINNDSFSQSPINCDEYSQNSLYGTIDRLIVKKNGTSCSSSSKSGVMYTNNYNSITKDPKMRNSTSYIINNDDDLFEKSEIHF